MKKEETNNSNNEVSKFWSLAHAGEIFLKDDFYQQAFRVILPEKEAYCKNPGGKEFSCVITADKIEHSMVYKNLISEEEYLKF